MNILKNQMRLARLPMQSIFDAHKFKMRKGLTLLEVGIVLMISVVALTGGASFYSDYLKNQTNTVTAQQMKDVSKAFERYVTDNYAQLVSDAQATGWARIDVEDLKPQYLSDAFLNKNPFGQNYVLAVRKPSPTIANLEAVVFTDGGEEIEPDRALAISQYVGASGGFTRKGGSPSEVRATFDGYQLNLHDFGMPAPNGSGKLGSAMLRNEVGSVALDYLYRSRIPGRPELNQMTTALNMSDNDIHAVKQLNATKITTTGSIEIGGDLEVGGDIKAEGDIISSRSLRGKDVFAENDIVAGKNITAKDGNVQARDVLALEQVSGNTLLPNLTVAANSSCAAYSAGSVAKTSQGMLLSCQEGVWKSASGDGCYYNGVQYPVSYHRNLGFFDRAYWYDVCTGNGAWQRVADNKD